MCVRFIVAEMASVNAQGTPALSLRNGCRCVPEAGVTVEDLLLIIGDKLGFENIVSASRMNKAVVVFLKSESLVNELTVSGIWIKETFVPVTPLSAPATKITISNVPPFISNEVIVKELLRFGKIASPVKAVPLGCKNAALKHVLSFRRHVYMFLISPERTLEVSFRVMHGESSFMVYASTENLRCFECGDLGHKRFTCPKNNEQRTSTSSSGEGNVDHHISVESPQRTEGKDKGVTEEVKVQQEVSGIIHVNAGCVEQPECSRLTVKAVVNTETDDDQSDVDDVCDSIVQSGGASEVGMDEETESLSQYTDDGIREDEQWSDVFKRAENDLYSLEQINAFLDQTKGKAGVEISDYFPDVEKFIASVVRARKASSYDELTQQKRFRLKKHLTAVRSGRKSGKARGKSK